MTKYKVDMFKFFANIFNRIAPLKLPPHRWPGRFPTTTCYGTNKANFVTLKEDSKEFKIHVDKDGSLYVLVPHKKAPLFLEITYLVYA